MVFNSFTFLIFFSTVYIVYWSFNKNLKIQNILLLLSSYIFYAWWDWRFLFLIILSSIIDYSIGKKLEKTKSEKLRKQFLILSLVSNLGMLCFFKYYNFFSQSFTELMNIFGYYPNNLTLNIILPVGISFYTFQTLSYTIDIYQRKTNATKDIVCFFCFVAFFPQLVAGPIERAKDLIPQIQKKRLFSKQMTKEGLIQIIIGLVRKIVIADNIGKYVDIIYTNHELYNSATLLLATFLFGFQIYYDFAGYSDIAIGSAKLMGFKFNQNFNLPYFSKTISEFWRRWHISLSKWLRDYLYIPLGGNRKKTSITYRNLFLTMLLGGLWHGSSWNFIIWGGLHGIFLIFEKFYLKTFKKSTFWNLINSLNTFIFVMFMWIFFRSNSLNSSISIIKEIFNFNFSYIETANFAHFVIILFVLFLGIIFDLYLLRKNKKVETLATNFSLIQMIIFTSVAITFINLFYSKSENFIYFQF